MVFETLRQWIPSLGGLSGMAIVTLIVLFIIAGILLGVTVYFVVKLLKFNKKIVIFENLSGQGYTVTGKDRGMLVKVGDGGEEVLYLWRRKLYRTAYGKRMGKRTYWFAIGGDGYWHNIVLEDIDKKLGVMGVRPIDKDLRYMHVAIRRNLKDRFQKTTFWEKYGGLIAYVGLIVITAIMMWLLFDKYFQVAGASNEAVKAAAEVLKETRRILGALDSIKGTGGLVTAP